MQQASWAIFETGPPLCSCLQIPHPICKPQTFPHPNCSVHFFFLPYLPCIQIKSASFHQFANMTRSYSRDAPPFANSDLPRISDRCYWYPTVTTLLNSSVWMKTLHTRPCFLRRRENLSWHADTSTTPQLDNIIKWRTPAFRARKTVDKLLSHFAPNKVFRVNRKSTLYCTRKFN